MHTLEKIADARLKPFAIWVPKSGSTAAAVPEAMKLVADPRVENFWDEDGAALKAFQPPLGLDQDAWDLYLIYLPGTVWEGAIPPKPVFFMHQLWKAPDAPLFDGPVFAEKVRAALSGSLVSSPRPDTQDHTKTSSKW